MTNSPDHISLGTLWPFLDNPFRVGRAALYECPSQRLYSKVYLVNTSIQTLATATANASARQELFMVATAILSIYLTAPRADLYPITLLFLEMKKTVCSSCLIYVATPLVAVSIAVFDPASWEEPLIWKFFSKAAFHPTYRDIIVLQVIGADDDVLVYLNIHSVSA